MVVKVTRLLPRSMRLTIRWTRTLLHRTFFEMKLRAGRKLCWLLTLTLVAMTLLFMTSSSSLPPPPTTRVCNHPHLPSPVVQNALRDPCDSSAGLMQHGKPGEEAAGHRRLPGRLRQEGNRPRVFTFKMDNVSKEGSASLFEATQLAGGRGRQKRIYFLRNRHGQGAVQPARPRPPQDPETLREMMGRRQSIRLPPDASQKVGETKLERQVRRFSDGESENRGVVMGGRPLMRLLPKGRENVGETARGRPQRQLPYEGLGVGDNVIGPKGHGGEHREETEEDSLFYLLQADTRQPQTATDSTASGQLQGHRDSPHLRQLHRTPCVARHHVFFAKVHKTGSSTMANILQRYGFARRLNFVLPRKRLHSVSYNYISMAGQTIDVHNLIPPPRGQTYDILWNHAIYDSDFYHQLMPPDTFFFSILRHPLEQFVSTFEYYGRMSGGRLNEILQQNKSNPLSVYLQDPSRFPWLGGVISYVRNKQAQDLGMNSTHVLNATLRERHLHQLDKDFHWVMITKYFDESLVMLRRLLCWEIKDVIYIPKNRNVHKQKRVFTPQDKQAHRQLNEADYELYEFFLTRLKKSLSRQPADFWQEVRLFKALLKEVQTHCAQPGKKAPLIVTASPWSRQFRVLNSDCKLMQKHELLFLDDLVVDTVHRYLKSVSEAA